MRRCDYEYSTLILALLSGILLAATLSSAACSPGPGEADEVATQQTGVSRDCEVLAAVATQHYRFNNTTNPPPALKLDPDGTSWAPDCDWARYGLTFRHHDAASTKPEDGRFVSFRPPIYETGKVTVETGIVLGPLDGRGGSCQLESTGGAWRVVRCDESWIS